MFLLVAVSPFIYYLISIFSAARFFSEPAKHAAIASDFTPSVSILKPVRGTDPDAYENFASFCTQDYPDYEMVFCVHDKNDSAAPVLEKLIRDFPNSKIRVLFGSGRTAINDKVAKLVRLVQEARHEVLVINDADVRVKSDYLRSVVAPLKDPKVGGVTCLYVSTHETSFIQHLQSIGMISDFFPGVLVARQLDGVKFAFGQTIVTTKPRLANFGGFEAIENKPADDLLTGRLIAQQGVDVELSHYVVETVADFQTLPELLYKRVRWMTVMRHMRPWGHFGLLFTFGLPWSVLVAALIPNFRIGVIYLATYLVLRFFMTWQIGVWGLKQSGVWKNMPLIPAWDLFAFAIWLVSLGRSTIRWRNVDYKIRDGRLVPAIQKDSTKFSN